MSARAPLLAALLLAAAHAWGAAWDVKALMDALRDHRPARAQFSETRHLALLDRPLESSGELTFTPPDRLEKRTTSPGTERLVVDRDTLSVERAGRTRTFALRDYPQAAALAGGIRATLAGDRAALERDYALALDGNARAWHLTLRPRAAALSAIVKRIEVSGNGPDVRRIETQQADGDWSVLLVTPVAR
jgi:outer membrane lipoprotein-sorting protein